MINGDVRLNIRILLPLWTCNAVVERSGLDVSLLRKFDGKHRRPGMRDVGRLVSDRARTVEPMISDS